MQQLPLGTLLRLVAFLGGLTVSGTTLSGNVKDRSSVPYYKSGQNGACCRAPGRAYIPAGGLRLSDEKSGELE